ncbi:hypothetical protein B0H13DRAFT_1867339 [Mycena leptocephala]|nr:hypothetical protein B0H13DRAFT_1867339 [Mycena leptocephala]
MGKEFFKNAESRHSQSNRYPAIPLSFQKQYSGSSRLFSSFGGRLIHGTVATSALIVPRRSFTLELKPCRVVRSLTRCPFFPFSLPPAFARILPPYSPLSLTLFPTPTDNDTFYEGGSGNGSILGSMRHEQSGEAGAGWDGGAGGCVVWGQGRGGRDEERERERGQEKDKDKERERGGKNVRTQTITVESEREKAGGGWKGKKKKKERQ